MEADGPQLPRLVDRCVAMENYPWTRFAEVGEVDAYSPLPIFLFDRYWVGQPVGVFHLPNWSNIEEAIYLVIDSFGLFWAKFASFLFDWFTGKVNVYFMWADVDAYALHVQSGPSEMVNIFS